MANITHSCAHRLPAAALQRARPLRRAGVTTALPRLADLVPWLSGAAGGKGAANPYQAERDELLELLVAGAEGPDDSSGGGGGSGGRARSSAGRRDAARERRVSQLVDALLESRLPFEEARLGGGPWVVLYTKGALQL